MLSRLSRSVHRNTTAVRSVSTVAELYQSTVAANESKRVLTVPHQRLVWDGQRLLRHANALTHGLLHAGYKKGSKIAAWMTTETELLCLHYAASAGGFQVVGIDPSASFETVFDIVKEEGCRGLMFSQRFSGEHRGFKMSEWIPQLEDLESGDQLLLKQCRSLKHVINTGFEGPEGLTQYREITVYDPAHDPLAEVATFLKGTDTVFVHYDTTDASSPKRAAALSQNDILEIAHDAGKKMGLGHKDAVAVTAPLHTPLGYASGVVAAHAAGARVILPSKEFAADKVAEVLAEQNATHVVVGAGQAAALNSAAAGAGLTELRGGGAPEAGQKVAAATLQQL